jgi:hypothetical protein
MSRVEESSSNLLSVWQIIYETANLRTRYSELVAFPSLLKAMNYALERAKAQDLVLQAVDQTQGPSEDQTYERRVEKMQQMSQRPME